MKLRKRVTLMAVTVSVIFAVCWLTDSISYILSIYTSVHASSDVTYIATSIMIMFNSSVNPIVYALVNKRFREKIKQMMCCNYRPTTDMIPLTGEPRELILLAEPSTRLGELFTAARQERRMANSSLL